MRKLLIFASLIVAAPAISQEKVDPRAIDDCNAQYNAFTEIAECLPAADVGVRMLDFVVSEAAFGQLAQPVVDTCLERNGGQYQDSWACVRNAYKAALELGAMLPDGAEIADPLFAPLNRPEISTAIEAAEEKAQARHPQVSMWGLNMFRPLK